MNLPVRRHAIRDALQALMRADRALVSYAQHGQREDLDLAIERAADLVEALRREKQRDRRRPIPLLTVAEIHAESAA